MKDPVLGKIKAAAPCPAEWRLMYGDDRVRFCGRCSLHVYNLSDLTRAEAEDVILRTEGSLCVRFYRRADGTMLTQNCPVAGRAFRNRLARLRTHAIGAALSLLTFLGFVGACSLLPPKEEVITGAAMTPEPVTGGLLPTLVGGPYQGGLVMENSARVQVTEEHLRERAVFRVTPVYHLAGGSYVRGDVRVRILVSAGVVVRAEMIEGHPLLRDLAEGAAYRWQFEPMARNGKLTDVESVLTFHFGQ